MTINNLSTLLASQSISELRLLAKGILTIRQKMRATGLFPNDRELLACTGCDLTEDIDSEGRLIIYHHNGGVTGLDCGLRFEEISDGRFRCPLCATLLQAQEP